MKKFETKYGYFNESGDEYIIKTPHTPKPWINVISNGNYGLTISQAGGGFSWLDHSEYNRINRWHQDLVRDNWGKYIYFKDIDTGEIWNPSWSPCRRDMDEYSCAHGFGYTRFTTEYKGIRTILTIFVPVDKSVEIWDINFENLTDRKRNLSIYTYFEWCLGKGEDYHREFYNYFINTKFDMNRNSVIANKRLWDIPIEGRGHWNKSYPYIGFLSASEKISDFCFDKESFIGQFGDLKSPIAIQNKSMERKQGTFLDAVAGTKLEITIEANQTKKLHYLLGLAKDENGLDKYCSDYKTSEQVDKALEEVKHFWNDKLSAVKIDTPDASLNFLVNKWLTYQAISGRLWGRTAYYQQSGAYGYRDQLQDSQVFLEIDPKFTADQIALHAEHQFKDGHVLHWWHPITDKGLDSDYSDDLLWLPFVVINYLKETGNIDLLKEKFKYYDDPTPQPLYDHCCQAIDYSLNRVSKRCIPLIGGGDWNDGLSALGADNKGESFWIIHFLNYILIKFSEYLEEISKNQKAQEYHDAEKKLRKKLKQYAWDGKWFLRATNDKNENIGSHKNQEGKIFLNSQTWSVISESAELDYQKQAMKTVKEKLMKRNGPLLLYPGYSIPDEYIGYLSRYAPGTRENGGVYTHAATWAIWAFSKLGWDEEAAQTVEGINPIKNGMEPDRYLAEPYVTPGNIDGPNSPYYGRGGWTWYTGSAAWLRRNILEWFLGVRPVKDGLKIDPHIPDSWNSYSIERNFRGTIYTISFKNISVKAKTIQKILVNGQQISGNIIKDIDDDYCKVEVHL